MKTINFTRRTQILHPETPFERSYRFETLFEPHARANNHAATHFIRTAELHCLGKVGGLFRYGIIVESFSGQSFNNEPFLKKMAAAFGTIVLKVSEKGQITDICNFFQMKEQWSEIRINLCKDHYGMEFDHRIAAVEDVLSTEKKLVAFLQRPEMFGLYFNGLWEYTAPDYGRDLWTSTIHKKWTSETAFRLLMRSRPEEGRIEEATYDYDQGMLTDALICKETVAGTIKYSASCLG
ncbi:hypothetical protein C7T94_17740 [Pedobacter yulinensis]|uniref:Uncharacterized protein n=1 Tax=Pedobacter yulinensis TaxID=2126353 RepID=A0A2T3HGZ2_9SPHI|nr:hypothetical protein [Pedobacter yulinensis]PST81716.1 hypothetical protein C7T94_17740 [Pedobacter yulinensis]